MTRALLLLTIALVLASSVDAAPAAEPVVLHAEAPAQTAMARLVPAVARVEVLVEPDGTVSSANTVVPRPMFVTLLSERAACSWRFSPSRDDVQRSYLLTFVFAPVAPTDEASQWVVTREEDPLMLRIQYLQTTVRRLDRDEYGQVETKICRRHGIPMEIALAPISYGLPRSYSSDNPSDRAALEKAKAVWRAREAVFPEANLWVGGGGCIVQPEKTAEVHYCATCRRAREEWFRRRPGFEQYE